MIQASTRIGIVPLSNHIFSIRIMFQNQSFGGSVCLKSDSKKTKISNLEKLCRTICAAILFASKKTLYTYFGHRTVCLGVDDFRQKNSNFRLGKTTVLVQQNWLRLTLNDAEKKFFENSKNCGFSQSKVLIFFFVYAYTYDAQNLCVGVISDWKQDSRTICSKFDVFVFLVIRFVTHNSNRGTPIQWVLKYNFSNQGYRNTFYDF